MRRFFLILAGFGCLTLGTLGAQTKGGFTVYVDPYLQKGEGKKGLNFKGALASSTVGAFRSAGFTVFQNGGEKDERSRATFVVSGFFALEGDRLVFQTSVTHRASGRIVASDMASVFAGLTSLDIIKELMAGLVQKTKVFSEGLLKQQGKAVPLPDPLVIKSPDEGATVSWGGGEVIGTIAQGQVEAPFYPFPSDGSLVLSVKKPGYIGRSEVYPLSEETRELTLPGMIKEVTAEWGLSTGLGRILGLGGHYRHYFIPNQVYLAAEEDFYLQWLGRAGSRPVFHSDTWLSIGSYLFFPPESEFRLAVQMGLAGFLTFVGDQVQTYTDFALVPLDLALEFRHFGFPLFLEIKLPYALGIGNSLLGQKWMGINDSLPLVNLGVLWRF